MTSLSVNGKRIGRPPRPAQPWYGYACSECGGHKDYSALRCRKCKDGTMPEAFWRNVDASGDCWEWTACTSKGYGNFRGDGAHRIAYELLVGKVAPDLEIDHLCRNRRCVNPDHLEPVPPRVNALRGYSPLANFARRTHCGYGHELTVDNLVPSLLRRKGVRGCLTCHKARESRYGYARRRAA